MLFIHMYDYMVKECTNNEEEGFYKKIFENIKTSENSFFSSDIKKIEAPHEMEKYLNKYSELSDIIFRRKVKVRLTILRQLSTNNLSNSIFYKDIKKYFRKNIRKIISNKYISKKEKLVILIFLLNKNLFKFMCNYYTKKK